MSDRPVIVFGSKLIADRWAQKNHVDPKTVYLASQPDRIQGMIGPFTIVRVPADIWKPPSFACEQRVRETEDWIRRDQDLRTRNGKVVID